MTAAESRFVTAPDGLVLHALEYAVAGGATPVLCLTGLARTVADFAPLAEALAEGRHGPARRVVALDYRGRGRSEREAAGVYDLMVENADVLAVATALELHEAVVVGTSRGGLHAMILGATRPTLLRGVALNDIGPRIETAGLVRIRGYVGKLPQPRDIDDAIALLKTVGGAQFTGLSEAEWRLFAETTWETQEGGLVPRYDPRLSQGLAALDLDQPLPELWPQFEALAHVPLLAIRGENSDLLAPATLEEMLRRHPRAQALTVPGQGHAPLLADAATIGAICRFVANCD
jgi:pimeloyl-ACP methyl ester carboxylesterase